MGEQAARIDEPDERWFPHKRAAHEWYAEHGGTLTYSAFTRQKVLVIEGRRILRESVMRILLTEKDRRVTIDPQAYDTSRDEARMIRAKADREEMRRDQEMRALDKDWIEREAHDLEVCTWASLVRDNIAARLSKNLPALIHAAGGSLERLADVQAVIDQAIIDACNDIAASDEIELDFEE